MNSDIYFGELLKNKHEFIEASFKKLEPVDNKVTGEKAFEYFIKSNLSKQILAHIWNICDVDKDGCLCRPEFYYMSALVQARLEGHALPDKCPRSLILSVEDTLFPKKVFPKENRYDDLSQLFKHEEPQAREPDPHQIHIDTFHRFNDPLTGFMTGNVARELLLKTGLPKNVLAQIWQQSDQDNDGQLSLKEFVHAFTLVDQYKDYNGLKFQNNQLNLIEKTSDQSNLIEGTSDQLKNNEIINDNRNSIPKQLNYNPQITVNLNKIIEAANIKIQNNKKILKDLNLLNEELENKINESNLKLKQLKDSKNLNASKSLDFDVFAPIETNQLQSDFQPSSLNMYRHDSLNNNQLTRVEIKKLNEISNSLDSVNINDKYTPTLKSDSLNNNVEYADNFFSVNSNPLSRRDSDNMIYDDIIVKTNDSDVKTENNRENNDFGLIGLTDDFRVSSDKTDFPRNSAPISKKEKRHSDPKKNLTKQDTQESSNKSQPKLTKSIKRLFGFKKSDKKEQVNSEPPLQLEELKISQSISISETPVQEPDLRNKTSFTPYLYNEPFKKSDSMISTKESPQESVDNIEEIDPPLTVIAIKDFKSHETRFSFKKGDKFDVTFKCEMTYYAEIGENCDWFPANCVKIYEEVSSFENFYTFNNMRIGILDFQAEESDEISFIRDDVLIDDEDLDEWVGGYSNGKMGIYPKEYTEKIYEFKLIRVSEILRSFDTDNDYELKLKKGHKVAILHENSHDWVFGIKENSEKPGFFPRHCIG